MNTNDEERFSQLARRNLAGQLSSSEHEELQSFFAAQPALKERFRHMRLEVAVAREILPLLDDIEHPRGPVPTLPSARLQAKVRTTLPESPDRRRKLFESLMEMLAASRLPHEQQPATIEELKAAIFAGQRTPTHRAARFAAALDEPSPRPSPLQAWPRTTPDFGQADSHQLEPEGRIRHVLERLERLEQQVRSCREELGFLLEATRLPRERIESPRKAEET